MKFFKRPAHTLLYITGSQIFRLDSNRKGQSIGEIESFDVACESSNALPPAIDKFINQTLNPLGRKVWILYARLSTYVLSLPEMQVAGLNAEMLEQALQFEYESLSGESLKKSRFSQQLLWTEDEMSHFWISFIAADTLNKLDVVLKEAHCSLGGLGHCGGLPDLLNPNPVDSWLKLEYWPDTLFALTNSPNTGLTMQIFHPEQNNYWQQEIQHWLAANAKLEASEVWLSGEQVELMPQIQQQYFLNAGQSLKPWLEKWLLALLFHHARGLALIQTKSDVNQDLLYMLASGGIALLLCGVHLGWTLYQTNSYKAQFEELTKAKIQMENMRKEISKSQDEISKLEAESAKLGANLSAVPKAMAALKLRPARLLKILAHHSPQDLVIESIQIQEQAIMVSGASLQAELSNQLANMMEKPLAKMGWKLGTPTKKSLDLFGLNNGPWSFELVLEDLGLKGFNQDEKKP